MKKIGLLVLALVLALGSLGVAYARWSDTVSITGTVTAGKVCVEWDDAYSTDRCPYGNPWYVGPGNGDANVDVAAITGNEDGWPNEGIYDFDTYFTDKNAACTQVTEIGDHQLLITVNNAYPLYFGDVEVEYCNCGTIPVKIQSIEIEALNFTLADQPWADDANPGNGGEIYVTVVPLDAAIGDQLEVGDCTAHSFKFIVQQSAEQNRGQNDDPYQFTVTWTVVQWNEFEED